MPLLFETQVAHEGVLGIWKIDESETEFLSRLTLSKSEVDNLNKIKGVGRRIQWLAVRYLLHHLSGRPKRMELLKDEYGKPYLPDSAHHISISHSRDLAAVLASKVPCGVDIQFPVEKIERLVPRFCAPAELRAISEAPTREALSVMHVLWGAKECIYKAYGERGVDYRKSILIDQPLELFNRPGEGLLTKDKLAFTYEIHAESVLDYILTYCFLKK